MRFKRLNKGNLQGFADIYVDKWDLELFGLALYMKDGKRWVSFPSREYHTQEGEKKYLNHYRFRDKENYNRFQEGCKAAIDKWCKENPEQPQQSPPQQPQSYMSQEEIPF